MIQSTDNYSTFENTLKIDDCEIFFTYQIKDVLRVLNMLIVRLEIPKGIVFNENVFGISLIEKKIKWQIAKLTYGNEVDCPFVGMAFYENQLRINNWCSIYLIVDPITGEIIKRSDPSKY